MSVRKLLLRSAVLIVSTAGFGAGTAQSAIPATPSPSIAKSSAGAPGERFRDCPECPEMVVIPRGQFTMSQKPASDGRSDDDPEGVDKTVPARAVSIDTPIALSIFDITREEFSHFVKASGHPSDTGCYVWKNLTWIDDRSKNWRRPGFHQTPRDPAVCVNWDDAQAYIHWLNTKLTKEGSLGDGQYRLPSWEELEYAARAGSSTQYYWGNEPSRDHANYGADTCMPCRPMQRGADRWRYTSPSGSFPPNSFGLYDVAGNVWQWTNSCVRRGSAGLQSDSVDADDACTLFAIHGGSWLEYPQYLQSGEYSLDRRINRNQQLGFRVARILATETPKISSPQVERRTPSTAALLDKTSTQDIGSRQHTFHDCPQCPEMVVIPAGSFIMGSPPAQYTWDKRERPEHRVSFSEPFALGIYDVTRDQYRVFVEETHWESGAGCDVVDPEARWLNDPARSWRDPAFRQSDRDPVVCVSWDDAQAYIRWLNHRVRPQPSEGGALDGPYRLPSEAEWEYAARGGSYTPYYWGDSATHDVANYGLDQCSPCGAERSGRDQWLFTSPVGSFAPNSFGLYDMLGNVWQWTQDCMHYSYDGAPVDGSVWGGGECKLRVLRGGSWLDPAHFMTVTLRNPWGPATHNFANGFRVARSLD